MPMREIFTQDLDSNYCKTEQSEHDMEELSPRESAIEFIRQFARVYSCDNHGCDDLFGYVAN